MNNYIPTHPCIHPYIHTSIPPYIHTCIHSSIHPYIHTFIHPYIHPYIDTSIHPYMHPFIHTSIHPFIHTSIHTSIHPFSHPSKGPRNQGTKGAGEVPRKGRPVDVATDEQARHRRAHGYVSTGACETFTEESHTGVTLVWLATRANQRPDILHALKSRS